MPGGRPPKSIALKRLEGDTRQRGATQYEKDLGGAFEARRGRPPLPDVLRFVAIDSEDPKEASARQALLGLAMGHWEYLADELEREKMLASLDEGMLTTAALIYAQMVIAGAGIRVKDFVDLTQRYMQVADRMGLNESARVKLPKRGEPQKDAGQSRMSSFLVSRKSA